MTPTFMGSEPPRTDTGRYAGTSILDEELSAGLALVNELRKPGFYDALEEKSDFFAEGLLRIAEEANVSTVLNRIGS